MLAHVLALRDDAPGQVPALSQVLPALDLLGVQLAAVTGALTDRMTRDHGWRFMTVGRLLERLVGLSVQLGTFVATDALDQAAGMELVLELFDGCPARTPDAARQWAAQSLPRIQLEAQAVGAALRIAALAPGAARMNKQTLRAFQAQKMPTTPDHQAQIAIKTIVDPYAYADSAEHREGITAFLEKRSPVF